MNLPEIVAATLDLYVCVIGIKVAIYDCDRHPLIRVAFGFLAIVAATSAFVSFVVKTPESAETILVFQRIMTDATFVILCGVFAEEKTTSEIV